MTDQQINYIGFAVLAALFWYVQIYRPRKKMRDPGELTLKPVMNRDDRDMYESIRKVFPAPYILNYLSRAGVGCCIFTPGTAIEKMEESLQEAAEALREMLNGQTTDGELPVTA